MKNVAYLINVIFFSSWLILLCAEDPWESRWTLCYTLLPSTRVSLAGPHHWLPIPVAQLDIWYLKRLTLWWRQVFDLTAKAALIRAYQWKQGSSLLSCLLFLFIFSVSFHSGTFSPCFLVFSVLCFSSSFFPYPSCALSSAITSYFSSLLSLPPSGLFWTRAFFLSLYFLLHL